MLELSRLYRPGRLSPVIALLLVALSLPALAAPRVVTDVTPVHSLVAQVMAGVAEPQLVIQPGASPHRYSMRPSEAAALEQADVVFWMGEPLTPWLGRALGNLAPDARVVSLLAAEDTQRYAFRDRVLSAAEADDHHDHDHDHDAADDHHDHNHGAADDHHDHDHGAADDHHDHDHAGTDPHAWLDPVNARYWLAVIAQTLAAEDPANADAYRRNAAAGQARIDALLDSVEAAVEPVREKAFIVFHDAYQYYERRFGMNAVGAIALSDASDPGPAHIARIQAIVDAHDVTCVFAEPQFNPGLVETVARDTPARTGVLDPLGSDIATGPDFYPALINELTARLVDCLQGA